MIDIIIDDPSAKLHNIEAHCFIIDDVEYEWQDGHYFKRVGEKKTGESFGELALLEESGNGTRAATIKVEEDVNFATLSKKDYNNSLRRIEARLVTEQVEFLQNIPCFKTQSKKALTLFTKYLRKIDYTYGNKVYSEGMPAYKIFIVLSGDFELQKGIRRCENFFENNVNA